MSIKIKVQRDLLRTEATVELPAEVSEVHEELKAMKTDGKMVVLYNKGHVQGINIEQNSKMSEADSAETRARLGVKDVRL